MSITKPECLKILPKYTMFPNLIKINMTIKFLTTKLKLTSSDETKVSSWPISSAVGGRR